MTVLFLESTVHSRITPVEGIRLVLATVLESPPVEGIRLALSTILSELSNIPNLQIMPDSNLTGLKSITYTIMILVQYRKFNKYVTCYNECSNLTRRIAGNKPRVIKLVVTIGLDIDIIEIVEENAIDMA